MHRRRSLSVIAIVLAILGTDAIARGSFSSSRSSSFSSRSSSRSSSWGSRTTSKPSTISKTTSTSSKSKAISKSKVDSKQTKAVVSRDNAAAKKYGNKKAATAAYQQNLVKKNTYTSATPPATRPAYIPKTTTVGGRNVDVTYHVLPGGGYGYGYMDPVSGTFMALAANQMMVDAAMMRSAGYGHYDAMGNPIVHRQAAVVHHPASASTGVIIFMIFLGVGVVAIIAVVIANAS